MKTFKFLKLGLNIVWDWTSLPSNIQKWLFEKASRVIELMSIGALSALSIMFILEPQATETIPLYTHFKMIHPSVWMVVMITTLVGLLGTIVSNKNSWQMINGWLLIFSGLIFMLVSIAYWLSYPPFAPSMILTPSLSIICVLAGNNKMGLIKEKIHREE